MMNNDWQRLNIWMQLGNRFDFEEFKVACNQNSIEPQSALEFAQKAGMISCAIVAYPKLPVSEAYLKLIQENQIVTAPVTSAEGQPKNNPCGGCGGGKVR